MKITKIKEIQIENDVFKNEFEKLKNLYYNSKQMLENGNKEIDDLKEYKNKFNEQIILLNSIQKDCDKLNKDNIELKEKINQIEGIIEKNKIEKEKNEEGNIGKWVKIDKKTANKIFGKRKDDYYEKLEKMNKQKNDK